MPRLQRLQIMALDLARRVYPHPSLKWRHSDLRWQRDGNLPAIAGEYGMKAETLLAQQKAGLDNPAYRFDRDGAFFRWFADHAIQLQGASWLDVGADTGVVSAYLADLLNPSEFGIRAS